MDLKALVPLARVQSVRRSITFYEKLGFKVGDTHTPEGAGEPSWAWLLSGGAQLMLGQADDPIDSSTPAVLFYVYTPDVAGLRNKLAEAGVDVGPIESPFYAPGGEFRVTDPDGYVLMISHT